MGQAALVLQAVAHGDVMPEKEVRAKGKVLRVIPEKVIDEARGEEQMISRENIAEIKCSSERILSS